jgi:glycosyltransferase involved in cell wall biosynthesis
VITICQELQESVERMGVGERALLIENVMGGDVEDTPSMSPADVRKRWNISDGAPLVLYTGTFEAYQGVELLIHASARLARSHPHLRVLIVGGEPAQVEAAQALAHSIGAGDVTVFTGQQPAREIPAFIGACDLLVSPRLRGTNTPLKIYSYLRSGKPIVATDLLTHTQVLTPEVARLVAVDAAALADAIADLVDRPEERSRLSAAAGHLSATRYSREAYLRQTAKAYARLIGGEAADDRDERATDQSASDPPPGNARSVSARPDWARR